MAQARGAPAAYDDLFVWPTPATQRSRPQPAPAPRPRRKRKRRPSRLVRLRRIVALTVLMSLAWAGISFFSAISAPSNSPFGVRAVEWLRNNGAAWLVSDIESIYYTWNAPSTGGPGLRSLPNVGTGGSAHAAAYAPGSITPVIDPPLPGEGQWHATGPVVAGAAPVLVTTFRPDPSYPQMVAGVAWIDASRTWLALYPGRYEPPSDANPGPMDVPGQLRGRLLATFNSGFKLEDSGGGFVAFGRLYAPLRDGLAPLVRFRDGTADVRAWSGGPDPGPEVSFARQNLPLIVQGGQLNPRLSDGPRWGATLGNAVRVWRFGG